MRKIGLIAATAAASFSVVAVAHAVDVNHALTIKVTGKKGTAAAPKPVSLEVKTGTTAKDPKLDGSYGTRSVVIHFDKNLKFNTTRFPVCSKITVASKPETCPKGSLVGRGQTRSVAGAPQLVNNPTVEAYNSAGGKLQLRLVKSPGDVLDSKQVLTGTLRPDTGKFGKKLVVPIPEKLQINNGLFVTIRAFSTLISNKPFIKGGKKNYYVESKGCKGSYQFKGDFVLTDGKKDSVVTTSKC